MSRALVLTDETARHPFRMSLPPHVRLGFDPIALKRGWALTAEDLRDFLLAYCACLLAVTVFIA